MRLTAEMFQQIVDALKSDSAGSKEKRRQPRVGMGAETELVTVSENGKRLAGKARVRDLSASGIGLVFSQPLAKDQRFVLQLESTRNQPIWLVCLAAYCKPTRTEFSIGARVKQVLRSDQISKLEAQAGAAPAAPAAPASPAAPAALPVSSPTHVPIPTATALESDIARISRAILG